MCVYVFSWINGCSELCNLIFQLAYDSVDNTQSCISFIKVKRGRGEGEGEI